MADKSIEQLNAAERVNSSDLFVLQQSGTAKKLTGQQLENWLLSLADGHGGIQSIVKVSTSGLVDTYRITLADTTTFNFTVTNGKSINSISKTGTSGLVDTYTIAYNNGTNSTFTVTNGAKGDKGDADHVYIKWASVPNPGNTDMSDIPDAYIGVCTTTASSAPTTASSYKWYQYKGAKGDKGDNSVVNSSTVDYMVADSGSVVPSGSWTTTIPNVPQGKYLWTRTTINFNSGSPIVTYSVARSGIDGSGSVASVNEYSPDENGNVTVTASGIQTEDGYSVQSHLDNVDWTASVASNPNLLDNWYFANPVNQRGITTFTVGQYGIDRWKLISGSATVNSDGTITLNGTIRQILENAVDGAVTASVVTASGTATASYNSANKQFDITSSGGVIKAAKLEYGSVSTLANDHAPDYATELLKCQRYAYIGNYKFMPSKFYGTNYLLGDFKFPTKMRAVPNVTIKSWAGTDNAVTIWTSGGDAPGITARCNEQTLSEEGFNAVGAIAGSFNTAETYSFMVSAIADL